MVILKYIYCLIRKSGPYQNSPGVPLLTGFTIGIFLFSIPAQAMLPRGAMLSLFSAAQENQKLKKKDDKVDINLKKKKTEKDEFDEFEEEEKSLGFQFIFNGFVEFENIISTYLYQEPEDINKKNEFRVKLNMQLGNENYYLKLVPNFYFMPFFLSDGLYDDYRYSNKQFTFARNCRMSGEHFELSFNEFFVNVGFEHFRLRLGNQIYAWGTADIFNPTSYINPSDSRELFYKDADENKLGVPSFSSMIFVSDFTIEFVFVPIHVGALSPVADNFWAYHYILGKYNLFEIREGKFKAMDPAGENLGYGLRFAGSVKGVDFSVSLYHGPDNTPMLRPYSYLEDSSDIEVRQEYRTSTNLGADISFKLWKFEIHGEISYSPNKYGVVDEVPDDFVVNDSNLQTLLSDPFRIKQSHYISYALGFNFIWKDLVCAAEWLQSAYFDSSLMEPFNSYFLAMSVSYSFLEELIQLSMIGVVDVEDVGYIIMPRIDFDFHNGVSLKLAYSHIGCKPTDDINMFTIFKKHDIFILGVRYEF